MARIVPTADTAQTGRFALVDEASGETIGTGFLDISYVPELPGAARLNDIAFVMDERRADVSNEQLLREASTLGR